MTSHERSGAPVVTSPEQAAQILGVAMTADPQLVQQAYRRAARQAHPDGGGSAATFQRVHSAYELLLWQGSSEEQQRSVARYVVVWVRSRVHPWPVALAMLQGGLLVGTASLFGGAVWLYAAMGIATLLLIRALWTAVGSPPTEVAHWRHQWEQWRTRRAGDQWETGPIPTMTDERMREFEETGA